MHLQRAENQPDAAEQKEFADWLLEVEEGHIPTIRGLENNIIRLPNDIILPSQNINDLINFVYSNLTTNYFNPQYLVKHVILIPRITLSPSNTTLPFTLKRRQFPIQLAFAMTINKSQE